MTPTIVAGAPLTFTVRPRMLGSPPKRRCQAPWLRTITLAFPGISSSWVKPRPSTGLTLRSSNVSHDTAANSTRSGPSVVASAAAPPVMYAAMRSKTEFCLRQSRKFAGETEKRPYCGTTSCTRTRPSGSG